MAVKSSTKVLDKVFVRLRFDIPQSVRAYSRKMDQRLLVTRYLGEEAKRTIQLAQAQVRTQLS